MMPNLKYGMPFIEFAALWEKDEIPERWSHPDEHILHLRRYVGHERLIMVGGAGLVRDGAKKPGFS
jgi:hypothetical protein